MLLAVDAVCLDNASALIAFSKDAVSGYILNQIEDGCPHAKSNTKDGKPNKKEAAQAHLCGPASRQTAYTLLQLSMKHSMKTGHIQNIKISHNLFIL